MDTLIAVLHVATAVFIVGPLAGIPHVALRFIRQRNGAVVRSLARTTEIFNYLSLLTFAFGFGALALASPPAGIPKPSFADMWVWLSTVLYVAAFVLTLFVVVPSMKRAASDVEKSADEKPAGYPAIAATAGVVSILLVVVVVLMIAKP